MSSIPFPMHRPGYRLSAYLLAIALTMIASSKACAQGATAAPAPPPAAPTTAQPANKAASEPSWLHRQWLAAKGFVTSLVSPSSEKTAVAPGAPGGAGAAKAPPPQVIVSQPLVKQAVEWDEYTARFDATESVEIRARVSGYLNDVHFKDGQMVKKGDLLFSIDPRPFERVLDQARAELAQARTRVENTSKDVERGRPLVDRKILSEKVFDDRENLKRDAEAAAKVAEAKVKTAELDLSFTRITAPMSGRISRAALSPGNWVSAGGASNATVLTSIVSQDPLHIYFDVSENNFLKYKRLGQAGATGGGVTLGGVVEIALPDEKGFPHKGKLDFTENRLDAGTGTLRVRAVVENKAGLFSPGMFARVRIAGSPARDTVLLPDEAIGTDQTNKFVYVVGDDSRAMRRVIETGPMVDGLRAVRSGLKPTDWVVVRGVQRARPGQPVTPKREPLKISAADGPQPARAN